MDIENIRDGELELALIIRRSYRGDGIKFFTPNHYSQQIGYMNRPAGYIIQPHVHNSVSREVHFTNEVLIVRSGLVQVDFFSEQRIYLCSRELSEGDIVLLIRGGHGFKMLQATEMVEIKQGPYAGDLDKTRFVPK